jgi:hypothetical protein
MLSLRALLTLVVGAALTFGAAIGGTPRLRAQVRARMDAAQATAEAAVREVLHEAGAIELRSGSQAEATGSGSASAELEGGNEAEGSAVEAGATAGAQTDAALDIGEWLDWFFRTRLGSTAEASGQTGR